MTYTCNNKHGEIPPHARALALSVRAFGYDITTAVADIIDNSIAAQARNIWVGFEWAEKSSSIFIADDGYGMDEKKLIEAMRLGTIGSDEVRDKNDLGRFGLGLKTASFSQCKLLTVVSKTTEGTYVSKRWDLDLIIRENKWFLLNPPKNEIQELIKKVKEHGTVIEWKNLDKLFQWDTDSIENLSDYFLEIAEKVERHISLTYSSFSKGNRAIHFWINDRKIEMWDPFLSDNTFTRLLGEESVSLSKDKKVIFRPYILPHHSKLSAEEYSGAAGERGWNDQQGYYIYRNNRLIIAGDWLNPKMEKKEAYKLARIRIDIDNSMDDIWAIDVKKAKAIPPASLIQDIKRISNIARRESSNVFRHRGKVVARSADRNNSFVWQQKNKNNKYFFEINREHPLIKKLLTESDNPIEVERVIKVIESSIPIPMIAKADAENPKDIVTGYTRITDVELSEMFRDMYNLYIRHGKTHDEAISIVASSEPFIYFPEIVELFMK